MDVSGPFAADVKQITVQQKPLGGKVIIHYPTPPSCLLTWLLGQKLQLQATNGYPNATKYGVETVSNKPGSTVNGFGNKYASLSNGTLTGPAHLNMSHHGSNNPNSSITGSILNQTAGVLNNTTNGASTTSNLMRSLLNSTNKSSHHRNYFNHLNGSLLATSANSNGNVNSTFGAGDVSDQSTFSLLPTETFNGLKHHPVHNHTLSNAPNPSHRLSREKTNGQIDRNSNSNSRELSKQMSQEKTVNGVFARKESAYYGSQKENANGTTVANSLIGGSGSSGLLREKLSIQQQAPTSNANNSHNDANSILNSFYANNSTISTISTTQPPNSQQQKFRSSALTNHSVNSGHQQPQTQPQPPPHRGVLSSKQLNQIQMISHHNNVKKEDCLTSNGWFDYSFWIELPGFIICIGWF